MKPVRLTSETERDIAGYFWKGPRRIVYLKDFKGDENFHVVAADLGGGTPVDLTPFDKVRAMIVDEPLAFLLIKTHLSGTLAAALFVMPGGFLDGHFIVGYPALPWLAIMCVGWVLGRKLLAWPAADRSRIAARIRFSRRYRPKARRWTG